MDAVLLDFSRRDLGDAEVAEEGDQVQPKADSVTFDPARAALALGDDLVFFHELLRRLANVFSDAEDAGAIFAAQLKIPVLGDLLGELEAFLLGAGAKLFAPYGSGALPEPLVVSSVDVYFSAMYYMRCP